LPLAGGLSELLTGALIPVCCWGLISTLVLHLIELRSLFVVGGEWRLRQATLAFAAAVILIQRLGALHGKSIARTYVAALAATITLFALHNAFAYRLPAHPLVVFAINECLFLILWWVGHQIVAACSSDTDKARAAAESGILSLRRRAPEPAAEPPTDAEREARWAERLPGRHPGRVILYFSLFAIPAFGVGVYLFDARDYAARLRTGAWLFIYLWCAFALLFLSSLGQLRAYFEERNVSLPDPIGLTWLAIGGFVVTATLVAGVFLPQPPSLSGLFVRNRIVSVYHGWQSRYGVKEAIGGEGAGGQGQGESGDRGSRPFDRQAAQEMLRERYAPIDKLNDPGLSAQARNTEFEMTYQKLLTTSAGTNESLRRTFDVLVKVLLVLAAVCGLGVAYAIALAVWRGLSEGFAGFGWVRRMKARDRRRRKRSRDEAEEGVALRRFGKFANPFAGSTALRDGNELVRYLWEAMMALCAERGSPCAPDQTPYEFVGSRPPALEGFETPARHIADLFVFSEFSNQPIPESAIPGLRQFWSDLQRHARNIN